MTRYRVSVDTGGTFSDFVYLNEETGEFKINKLPSTPQDPSNAIINGIQDLFNSGVEASELIYFSHGTTVGTNALLEEKGVKTGLIVTKGFRGIYEVMEQSRPYGSAIFDSMYDKPAKLVEPSQTLEARERVDFKGQVLLPLDESHLRSALQPFKKEGVESIAVCLLFSFLYPKHEVRIKEIINEELPHCSVSLSSEIIPQIREYYRLSTTVINAYLHPILERYIHRLEERFNQLGIHTRQKYIMQSNGGTSTFKTASKKAVTTILSGPSGGVMAAVNLSKTSGYANLITFDMGGTSCDVSLIKDGNPTLSSRTKVDGRDINVPMMDINTVSAGGGTIAKVDQMGILEVGPHSAGAVPGPACYCKGGILPTVTDANLILGYLSESNFLGGNMVLDKERAIQAVEHHVSTHLRMQPEEAAEGIVQIVNVKMEEAIKAISTMRGFDLRDFMLVAFGGAGPIHAGQMAKDLGMAGVIIPPYPGVYSAMGLLMANVKHDYIQSKLHHLKASSCEHITESFQQLTEQARIDLINEGFTEELIQIDYSLDLRYAGQGYELTVSVDSGIISGEDIQVIRSTFDSTHQQLYGHKAENELVEIVSYRVSGIGKVPKVSTPSFEAQGKTLDDAFLEYREARFNQETLECPVYQRERLDIGLSVKGPAIIEQLDSTVVIYPEQFAQVDQWKNLVVKEATIHEHSKTSERRTPRSGVVSSN